MNHEAMFAFGLALACLAGVRAYLTVLGVGLAGLFGWVDLPANLQIVTSPWVLITAGALTAVEFSADKIPGVDSGWDLLSTVLRVPVGAFLAAASLSPDGELGMGALALGAGASFLTHAIKSTTRVAINASPEPLSNWTASVTEDVASIGTLALIISHPWWALGFLLVIIGTMGLLVFWLLRKLFRRRNRQKSTEGSFSTS